MQVLRFPGVIICEALSTQKGYVSDHSFKNHKEGTVIPMLETLERDLVSFPSDMANKL